MATPSTVSSSSPSRTPSPQPPAPQQQIRRRVPASHPTPSMFSSRKYSPLPTSANGHRRRAGGLPTWKRYLMVGTGAALLVIAGYAVFRPSLRDPAPQTYTPQLEDVNMGNPPLNEEIYKSPPFRPTDGPLGLGKVDQGDKDEVHILPIDMGKPNLEGDKTPVSFETVESGDNHDDGLDVEDDTPAHDSGKHPTSFETDPDPAGTTYCSKPHGSKPIVQYALTIDAGSTGSRIHAYKFNNCGPSPRLEYETFMMLQPGLSSFKRDAEGAAKSLDPLLKEANRVVPEKLRKCTPVEVKATAGLRILDKNDPGASGAILDAVRKNLETNWPYPVNGEKAVEIMEGKDEGVYAWITTNYLLGKIGEGVKTTDTLAVMDLGGASTQIVFEPKTSEEQPFAEGDHKYELKFGGKTHTLYQHSHLNYGLMRARRSVHNLVAFSWSFLQADVNWESLSAKQKVANPCLSRNTTRRVELDPPGRAPVNVTMYGGNGGYESCKRVVELVMAKDAICEVKPCSFNGVYQPSLIDTFKQGDFFALSYFTDRLLPLLPKTKDTGKISLGELKTLAEDVCAGPEHWPKRWKTEEALDELYDRPEYCLDLTFMHALLGLGYEITSERQLLVGKKIDGVELGWALGAGLALVGNADLKCLA